MVDGRPRERPQLAIRAFFDIEWRPVKDELADKVLIPILGDQYGEVLERRELEARVQDGAFLVSLLRRALPIAPDTLSMILAEGLDLWLEDHPGAEADELQSILTASRNLPPRSTRDADEIAIRAREKEVVKRRLAALTERSAEVRGLVDGAVARFNGVAGQARSSTRSTGC